VMAVDPVSTEAAQATAMLRKIEATQ
jgi:hypothetical protein